MKLRGIKIMILNPEKYNSQIDMMCPTCGHTQLELENKESNIIKCASCNRIMLKDELIRENGENIQAHVDNLKKNVTEDLRKGIGELLKKSFGKNVTIK